MTYGDVEDDMDEKTKEKIQSAKTVLSVFKSYEKYAYNSSDVKLVDLSYKKIDTIQYSDVVRYSNWMKNVADVPKSTPSDS